MFMRFHKHQLHTIKITTKLQNHIKQAQGRYFTSQQRRSLSVVKSVGNQKIKQINGDVSSITKSIFQTKEAVEPVRVAADRRK